MNEREHAKRLLARRERPPTTIGLLRETAGWKVPIAITGLALAAILLHIGAKTASALVLGIWTGALVRDLRFIHQAGRSWRFLARFIDWDAVRGAAEEEPGPAEDGSSA